MRPYLKLAALLLLPLAAIQPAAAQTPKKAAAATDWTRTVAALPNGAFLVGNPAAKNRLVEYFSYTCHFCHDFDGAPTTELKAGWIRSGLVAIEYRNYVRDPFDMAAALLVRCGGAPKFLAAHQAVFGNYTPWMDQAQKYADSQKDAPPQTDRGAQFVDIAAKTGLNATIGKLGISAAQQQACLTDKTVLSTLLALTASAWDADPNFEGTPGFILNGKPLDKTHDWTRLKPQLPAPSAALPAPRK